MVLRVDLAVLPAEALNIAAGCFVVVDVLRATTTIAALFGAGLQSLCVSAEIEEARTTARTQGRLLFGEVHGLRPEGFDYGNSPVEADAAPVSGRDGVLFTTNGTRALTALAGRGRVLAGALVNARAVAEEISGEAHVAVVCAGSEGGGRFAVDDFAAAAVIVRRIAAQQPDARLGDAARTASELAAGPGWAARAIRSSDHSRLLQRLGLGADVDFACGEDTSAAVAELSHTSGSTVLVRAAPARP